MYPRDAHLVQTVGLAALQTLEVNMLVVVLGNSTPIVAQSVLQCATVVQNLVKDTLVHERLECTIHSNPVIGRSNLSLNISIRQCVWMPKEQSENRRPARRSSKAMFPQKLCLCPPHYSVTSSCSFSKLLYMPLSIEYNSWCVPDSAMTPSLMTNILSTFRIVLRR